MRINETRMATKWDNTAMFLDQLHEMLKEAPANWDATEVAVGIFNSEFANIEKSQEDITRVVVSSAVKARLISATASSIGFGSYNANRINIDQRKIGMDLTPEEHKAVYKILEIRRDLSGGEIKHTAPITKIKAVVEEFNSQFARTLRDRDQSRFLSPAFTKTAGKLNALGTWLNLLNVEVITVAEVKVGKDYAEFCAAYFASKAPGINDKIAQEFKERAKYLSRGKRHERNTPQHIADKLETSIIGRVTEELGAIGVLSWLDHVKNAEQNSGQARG